MTNCFRLIKGEEMFSFMNITKALSDENRVRIVNALNGRSLCVQQIISLLKLAPSTVSKHISVLQKARLVDFVRNGKWVIYSLVSVDENPLIKDIVSFIEKGSGKSKQILLDEENIKQIQEQYCLVHNVKHNNGD